MTRAEQRKRAVKLTLPVFCGYIVLGIAFGATLAQSINLTLLRRIFAVVLIASGAISFFKKEPDAKKFEKPLYK